MGDLKHVPVLLNEAIFYLNVRKGMKYIDATFGGGHHTREIIKRGGIVLGIDADGQSLEKAKEAFRHEIKNEQVILIAGNFRNIERIAKEANFKGVEGIFFDLGLSSWQIDESARGFSYLRDEDLDMRFAKIVGSPTGAEILEKADFNELFNIIGKYGEEELASQIAKKIISARKENKIGKSGELAALLDKEFAYLPYKRRIQLLSRVFQSIRITVNDEINALIEGLDQAIAILDKGGRLAVISFHSIEDRIVKIRMRGRKLKSLTKKPVLASRKEIIKNRRSRSAKLRAAEKK